MRIAGERKEWDRIPIRAVNVAAGRYAEVQIRKKRSFNRFFIRLLALFRDPAGARTQDPNIKSVVLYQLSYGISVCRNGNRFRFGGANVRIYF